MLVVCGVRRRVGDRHDLYSDACGWLRAAAAVVADVAHVLVAARWRREASAAATDTPRRAEWVLGFARPTLVMKSCGPGDLSPAATAAVAGRVAEETRLRAGSTVDGRCAAPALNPAATGAATRAERARAREEGSGGSGSPNARAGREARGWYTIGAAFSALTGLRFSDSPRHQAGTVTSGGSGAPTHGLLRELPALCAVRALRVEVNDVDIALTRVSRCEQISALPVVITFPSDDENARGSHKKRRGSATRLRRIRKSRRRGAEPPPAHTAPRPAMHAVRLRFISGPSAFRSAARASRARRHLGGVDRRAPVVEPSPRRARHVAMGASRDAPDSGGAPPRVAVVGAGISGLTAASHLARGGCAVTVYETGRGPGGRTSTRRAGPDGAGWQFDHGAQYFSAKDPAFRAIVEDWRAEGLVAEWTGVFGTLDATTGTFVREDGSETRNAGSGLRP